ncbi:glycoprotein hormone beta-5-like [Nelusetta ayraudi]|uniref:glycoprotein hormone beta-5-like n=1 Tax=Nelusetta ayraudi TaxID=303726 RepID=UPI003F71F018
MWKARAASSSAKELLALTRSLARSLTRTERYRLRLPKHRQVPGFSRESPLFLAGLGSPTVFHCNCYDVRVSVHPNGLLKTTTRIDWFHSLLVVHGERHAGLLQTSNPARSSSMHLSFLVLLIAGTAAACAALTNTLHGFRGCAVREFSFVAHKPGCRTLRITTEACWGRCHTWEKPIPDPPYIHRHHRVCTYSQSSQMTARLPGCLPGVSPLYHYPMAVQCHCAPCSTQDTECETF